MTNLEQRSSDQLRPVKVTKDYLKHAEGSCLIEFGDTKVICSASIEDTVPPFLRDKGTGWVTAEYGMLPRSCNSRIRRDKAANSGRTHEIQRLIGRSLRAVIDLEQLGSRTVKIDCDVIQGDGGTRTASITGGFIALADALVKLKKDGFIKSVPLHDYVAAVSVGVLDQMTILDLNYEEDSQADVDMNVVMVGCGDFVEIQGTAEGKTFDRKLMNKLLDLAQNGINELFKIQKENLDGLEL